MTKIKEIPLLRIMALKDLDRISPIQLFAIFSTIIFLIAISISLPWRVLLTIGFIPFVYFLTLTILIRKALK